MWTTNFIKFCIQHFRYISPATTLVLMSTTSANNSPSVRTEAEFIEHAAVVQSTLAHFLAIKDLVDKNREEIIRPVLVKLIKNTVCPFVYILSTRLLKLIQVLFNNFMNHVSHHLFQELTPAVRKAIDEFSAIYPKFEIPKSFTGVMGLHARIHNQIVLPTTHKSKGTTL